MTAQDAPITEEYAPSVVLRHLLASRHSCRAYVAQAVPRETIEAILEMAQQTASWCNTQPWELCVTSGSATDRFRKELADHAASAVAAPDIPFPTEYAGKYLHRRADAARQLYESVGADSRQAVARQVAENFRLFGAPHLAIVTTPEMLGIYGAVDCGAYVGAFMLAARSMGVACIAQASLAAHSPFIRRFFSIPKDRWILCGLSFGYEERSHPANTFRTTRASTEAAVTWFDD